MQTFCYRISTLLLGIFGFLITAHSAQAQEVKVEQKDATTFSIRSKGAPQMADLSVEVPMVVLDQSRATLTLVALNSEGQPNPEASGPLQVSINGRKQTARFRDGEAKMEIPLKATSDFTLTAAALDLKKTFHLQSLPGWTSILPPIMAIALALIFREVLVALFIGLLTGTLLIHGFSPADWVSAFLAVFDRYIVQALNDEGHIGIIVFSTAIGGMVAVISKNGGMAGIVGALSRWARTPRSAQFITWLLGIAIFFDDYANTLIVGNTMRSVTDRFRISREKLAYIVDSTAAPVAATAFVTTWIGAELGYIENASQNLGLQESAYSMFLNSLRYSYYPFFTLVLMLFLIYFQKDFGPMHKAETRARSTGQLNAPESNEEAEKSSEGEENLRAFAPKPGIPHRWYNAFFPVLVVIGVTLAGLVHTGLQATELALAQAGKPTEAVWDHMAALNDGQAPGLLRKLGIIIGNASTTTALIWSSFSGLLLALVLSVSQGLLKLNRAMESMLDGFQAMLPALTILVMAWSLARLTEDLHTAQFLTRLVSGAVPYWLFPTLSFVLAAAVSFATGSSWGTMAILYPLMLPAAWSLCQEAGLPDAQAMEVLYHVVSTVLAGSVFGDHCTPISDTTILSSLASNCHHVAHVRTQLPYALTAGGVALLSSALLSHWLPFWLILPLGAALLGFLAFRFGSRDPQL